MKLSFHPTFRRAPSLAGEFGSLRGSGGVSRVKESYGVPKRPGRDWRVKFGAIEPSGFG
jgi:hypothetical protein